MADEDDLSEKQKKEIAKWFLLNSPAGEIKYVAKDLRSVLNDDNAYNMAASEAFPLYNKSHLMCLQLPDRSGDVLISSFSELDENEYLDPRTAQVATVDHVKQVCTEVRPAADEELSSPYIEEYRNGSWRSIWNIEFKDEIQRLEIRGRLQVGAHYFEEGNVQLDAKHECEDSTIFQSPEDCAFSVANIIRHHETEYLTSLEAAYSNLPDTTFKDLRRKLPVTRTLFPWHNTLQFSLTRDITKELGIGK
ncbi:F-actin-capping protein subunit alpha isoform X3 [Malania oleifera]|uniref:F-actin-capping protein subunit alpha isoform X3 n=1 Tax=Malania oleifera TaxID=397392 RepID=UPI0025AEA3D0|nr:F-actin-capping protein subunit alpha isoform X3 [Malania oleifera]